MDYAIVDQIIIPCLKDNYDLNSIWNDHKKTQMLRDALKSHAEIAKNQMSFRNKWAISIELGLLPIKDDNGEEIEIDREVTVADMEAVLVPIFQQSIDITKELLKRNNLTGSDVGALILVGGPTHSPILRRMLTEQITEKIDTSVDPMTVVAKGAALFASTISVPEIVMDDSRDKTKLQLEIKYEATSVEATEFVNIKLLKDTTTPENIFVEIVRNDGGWASGRKQMSARAEIFEVHLHEGRSNVFVINMYDGNGDKLDCQPAQFNILQGMVLDGMSVLPYHIGIGKWFETEEKGLFTPVKGLEKNKKLPATGVINGLKTTKTVRPGIIDDVIVIPIYQGDYHAEGTNPILNNLVHEVVISGESIPALLLEGSHVDITIKVDRSQQMQFSAYFPTIEHTEDLKIKIIKPQPPEVDFLAKELAKAKRTAQLVNAFDVSERIESLKKEFENEKGSADGKLKILESLRKELKKLDETQKEHEYPKVEQELKDVFFELEDILEDINANGYNKTLNMDKINARIQEYRKEIEYIIKEKDTKKAKELTKEIRQMDFEIRNAITDNAVDVELLRHINSDFNTINWKDATKARQLVNQGLQLAAAGKNSAIRQILVQLINLIPKDGRPPWLTD